MKSYTSHIMIQPGQYARAVILDCTSESSFSLQYGVPLNLGDHIDQYQWITLKREGKTMDLNENNNVMVFGMDLPGAYRFINNGTDDEQAVVVCDVFKDVLRGE